VADRILQAVAIRRELIQGVGTQDKLHDLVAKYAKANLYDASKGVGNARQVKRLTRDIARQMTQDFLPDAQRVAKASAEPILDRLGGTKLVDKANVLRGDVLQKMNLYHKRNLMAFHSELRMETQGLSGEIEAAFARAYRDGKPRKQLVTDLVQSHKDEMERIRVARGEIQDAGEKLADAEGRLAKASKRKMTRARREVRDARKALTKTKAKIRTSKDFFARFETKVQGHARDAIRREAEGAQTAYFKQAGYKTFTWIAVNAGEACPDCEARHGRTYTEAQQRSDGPGAGGTVCGPSCMCFLVPEDYHKKAGIEKPLRAPPKARPKRRETWRMRGRPVKASRAEALRKIPKAELTQTEKGALKEYTRSDYQTINPHLRGERTSKDIPKSAIRGQIKEIDSALEKLPRYEGTTYRKVGFGPESYQLDDFLAKHKPGRTVRYSEYLSTSRTRDATLGSWEASPKGDVRFSVKGKTGRVIENYAASGTEQEILFPRSSRFRVEAVGTTRKGGTDIILEEIVNAY